MEFVDCDNEKSVTDVNYFCHIVIPSKDHEKSKAFFEKVFRWKVQEVPGTSSLDVIPPEKGPSAELNSEVDVVVPAIHTHDIEAKLELIEECGGEKLRDKTPVGRDAEYGYYALFEDPSGNRMALYSQN